MTVNMNEFGAHHLHPRPRVYLAISHPSLYLPPIPGIFVSRSEALPYLLHIGGTILYIDGSRPACSDGPPMGGLSIYYNI